MKTRIFKRFRKDFHQFCFFPSVWYQISVRLGEFCWWKSRLLQSFWLKGLLRHSLEVSFMTHQWNNLWAMFWYKLIPRVWTMVQVFLCEDGTHWRIFSCTFLCLVVLTTESLFWRFFGPDLLGPKLPCQSRTRTLRDQLLHSHQHFLNEMVLFICQCDNSLQPIQIYVVQSCQRCIQCICFNWHTFNVKLQIEPSALLKSKSLQRSSWREDLTS